MESIGCGELADLIEGRLNFGAMPPLGGRWEPIGRVVTCCERVAPGDVYWAVESQEQGAHRLMEAFCRGARGAVSQCDAAGAFDGSFLITVDDAAETLCQFGRWRRANYEGKLAIIGPSLEAAQVIRFFDTIAADWSAGLCEVRCVCSAAESLATLDDQKFSLFSLTAESLSSFDEISHLCCPHVICINSLPLGKTTSKAPANDHDSVLAGIEGFPDDVCFVQIHLGEQSVTLQRSPFDEPPPQATSSGPGGPVEASKPIKESVDWQSVLPTLPLTKQSVALTCWGVARALNYSLPEDWLQRLVC